MSDEALRVLHLDHSVEAGGAELALGRLVRSGLWRARIVVPRGSPIGAFSEANGRGLVSRSGPSQPPGAARAGLFTAAVTGGRIIWAATALSARRDFRQADVVHANTTRSAVYAALACTLARKPLVVHLRDRAEPAALGRIGHLLFTRIALPAATSVIANSHSTLAAAALPASTDASVIPSPIGLSARTPTAQAGSVRTIGMVARLAPWKGQDLVMRAFASRFAGTAVRLRLVGGIAFDSGEYVAELRRLADELGIAGQVDFTGHRDDIATELASIDVCVQYSTRPEPLGQNLLQYLAAGKPVVAAAEGGPAEWIDDGVNGMLVPPRDVDALGDALQRLVDDRALRARLAQSASRTEGLEDDAVIAEAHRRVFERAARRLRAAEQDPHVLRIAHHAPSSAWRERERALRRLGVDVALISSKKWDVGGTTVTLDASGDSFVSGATTLGTHPSLFVFHPLALWRALGRRPDLIDLHEEPNALVTAEVLILRWLRRIRAPYVLYSAQNIDKRYPLPFRMIERLSLRGAAGAYVCNQEAAAILNRKGLRVPATYIPLGVDIDAFTPAERDLPEEVTVVGYVGRLERHKGVHVLLEAIALHPSRRLTVVGDGPQRRALADLAASLGLTDRVEFVGHASGEQLSALYRTFDVLAVPSLPTQTWREQFGRVAVEAMSAGVPVVASSSGALPDVVGGVGILVPPDDPRGLAGGLDDALEPSRWSALRRDGLRRAQDFSWDRIARDQKALYERALRPDEAGARGLRAIVVAYGDPANLDGCLEALDAAAQVTVVDNSGLAETEAVARRHGAVYIDAEANLGFAGGVNLALAQLDPAALVDVVLVNPDARATPGTLAKMRDALDADRRIAAVGVRQTNPDTGAAMRVWWPFPSPAGAWLEAAGLGRLNRRKGFAVGSVLLLRAEALRDVGPFDESFFLYAEETDWQRRARSRGWRITVADADATHEGGATSSDPSVREGHFYASQRTYVTKHFGRAGWQWFRLANIFGASIRARMLRGERAAQARRRVETFRDLRGSGALASGPNSSSPVEQES